MRLTFFLTTLLITASAIDAAEIQLTQIPTPNLEGLEQTVVDQIVDQQTKLQEMMEKGEPETPDLAMAFNDLGLLYHAYHLADSAKACYFNADSLMPGRSRWPHLVGLLEKGNDDLKAATTAFRRVLDLDPGNPPATVYLAEILVAENKPEEAANLLRPLLETNPNDPAVLALLGEVEEMAGSPEQAVTYLERALELVPNANRIHYPLALAYRTLRNMDKAREHLAKSGKVGVRPADPLADEVAALAQGERVYLLRGHSAFQAGRYAEAAEAFRKAVEAKPNSSRARVNLGTALGQTGDLAGAIEQFELALTLEPDNGTAHFNLGNTYLSAGKLKEALPHLEAASQEAPEDAQAHLSLATTLRGLGASIRALHHFRSARNAAPNLEEAWLGEASVLVDIGHSSEALRVLDRAHTAEPSRNRTAHALARMLAAAPDPSLRDGPRALDIALELFQTEPTIGHAQGVALAQAEVGQCAEAAQWQTKAIEAARSAGKEGLEARLSQALLHYNQEGGCRPPIAEAPSAPGPPS